MIKADKIWLDGKLVPFDDAPVHILTHALHYGIGVFEGIRAYQTARRPLGRLPAPRAHPAALRLGPHPLMEIPFQPEQLEQACIEVLKSEQARRGLHPAARLLRRRRDGRRRDEPGPGDDRRLDWGAYLSEEGLKRGIRAKVSSFTRSHVNVKMVAGQGDAAST